MMRNIFIVVFICFAAASNAQDIKVYPTNWWVGMKNDSLQLMFHGTNIGNAKVSIKSQHVKYLKTHQVENKNWLFVDVLISRQAKAGRFEIKLDDKVVMYELLKRRTSENGKSRIMGVTSKDLIYLIMPDRFANGNVANDIIPSMLETINGRDSLKGRHGGDLQGITGKLDYLNDLGVTTLWLNPVLENNRRRESFHGYAFTDHYAIDPRLGGEKAYIDLIEAAHRKGMKIIQDAVYNHVDINHITVKDMPMKDWLNQWPSFQNTTYKDQVLMDPYGSEADRKIMTDGWFTRSMPDLNQKNPFVADFLIQHAIWSTEYFGLDGFRIDTYAYCDLEFMNRCNQALLDEYPQLGIFGETWVHGMTNQSFFTKNNIENIFKSNLPGVTDFQLYYAMNDALNQPYGWTEGLSKLNLTLAADLVYQDPMKNSIFLDNHDLTRFYTTVGEDINKFKMGMNWLMTLRGIPQIYYGTEILMTGSTHPSDALVRKDFPGGWPGDPVNKFVPEGRTALENEAFNYIRKLANFRKSSSALQTGKTTQFVPFDGLYVYFRYDSTETIMVVSNTSEKPIALNADHYKERIGGNNALHDIISDEIILFKHEHVISPKSSKVYKLIVR